MDGIFPLVGTTWFLLALLCFAGGNWPVKALSPARQFLILLLIITGGTYLITHSSMGWVPAWWFPFLLVGLGTSTVTYLTRGMSPVSRAVAIILILFAAVSLCLSISASLGLWRMDAPSVSPFWKMGHFTDDQVWLLWFMGATSINYAFPVVTACWPFSRIPMPLGGLIACAFYLALTVVAAYLMRAMIGPVFHDMNEALTYAYMGVNWSLVIPWCLVSAWRSPGCGLGSARLEAGMTSGMASMTLMGSRRKGRRPMRDREMRDAAGVDGTAKKVRARVEHVFGAVERLWGFAMVLSRTGQERVADLCGNGARQQLPGARAPCGMSATAWRAQRASAREIELVDLELSQPASRIPDHAEPALWALNAAACSALT